MPVETRLDGHFSGLLQHPEDYVPHSSKFVQASLTEPEIT